jgi:deoxyinosine 3'endonuclease (endonuclease V)
VSKKQQKFNRMLNKVDKDTRADWEDEQFRLKQDLVLKDDFGWNLEDGSLKLVGAVDISYSKKDNQRAVAALIVMSYPKFEVVYEDYEQEETDYPYIPGFLAFKEVPSYEKLFKRLWDKSPELAPQVLLVDGNGVLHTRGFGCASHVGVVMDVPSIGVGKTVFAVDGITKDGVRQMCDERLLDKGDLAELVGRSGRLWGAALKSSADPYSEPIIISQGHRISLETSISVVKACLQSNRIPVPIDQADLRSRQKVKEIYDAPRNVKKQNKGGNPEEETKQDWGGGTWKKNP